MSKNRFIDTKFWSDSWIVELEPLERYLFLYLLTNEHTNIAGIYELPLRVMTFETGLSKEKLQKMIGRFTGKVFYLKEKWVYIINFEKHQRVRGNSSVGKGIENIKNALPSEIKTECDRLYTECPQTPPYLDSDLDSDLDLDLDSKERTRFTRPTLDEIKNYCDERNNSVNPQAFVDFYESNGWKVGKNSMKDWQAAIRTWEQRQDKPKRKIIRL